MCVPPTNIHVRYNIKFLLGRVIINKKILVKILLVLKLFNFNFKYESYQDSNL